MRKFAKQLQLRLGNSHIKGAKVRVANVAHAKYGTPAALEVEGVTSEDDLHTRENTPPVNRLGASGAFRSLTRGVALCFREIPLARVLVSLEVGRERTASLDQTLHRNRNTNLDSKNPNPKTTRA